MQNYWNIGILSLNLLIVNKISQYLNILIILTFSLETLKKQLMLLNNPRALAGGIEKTQTNGVLTPEHSFWVKTHLCLSCSFPPAKARGLFKS